VTEPARAPDAESASPLRRALRWIARHRLFVLLALTYAYFYQGGDPNQATRMFLVRSLVERHQPDITPYHAKTIDKSEFEGRFYSDKAPAVSMMAAAPYAGMRALDRAAGLDPSSRPVEQVKLHVIVILISGLSGVFAAYFLYRSLLLFGASSGIASFLTAGYGLGTLAFPFSTVLFGHETAAALVSASFFYAVEGRRSGLTPRRLALLGALWGLSLTTEYPTGLLVACQGLYVLAAELRPKPIARVLGWSFAGAFVPLAVHSAFLTWAFHRPFSLPYTHMAEPIFLSHVSTGLLGINLPTVTGIFGVFLSRYRGLFYYCPFLVVVFFGLRAWIGSGEARSELSLVGAQLVAYSVFCTGYYAWDGGGSTGPRHIVPALVFFVIPMLWYARERRGLVVTALALVPSAVFMLACTSVLVEMPEGDVWRANPLYEIVLARLARGEIATNHADIYFVDPRGDASYNLGTLLGLSSVASLVPLVALWLAAYAPTLRRRLAP
jgi:hypothetical protein